MSGAVRYALLLPVVAVGCLVAGIEIDPAFGDAGGDEGGSGADGDDGGQGGATGGRGGSSGSGGRATGGQGGSNRGGSDAGGDDAGGTETGGTGGNTGGMSTGGVSTGGAAAGKGGAGGTGAGAGGSGGSSGNAACANVVLLAACSNPGVSCPDQPCGLATVGRRRCECSQGIWGCTTCGYAGTAYENQPIITTCVPGVVDGASCSVGGDVCGPVNGAFCACYTNSEGDDVWDCTPPPSSWLCAGVHMRFETETDAPHYHALDDAAQLAMITDVRAATADYTMTLPAISNHTHDITLSAADLATLRAGGWIFNVTSTVTDGHSHTYQIDCEQ